MQPQSSPTDRILQALKARAGRGRDLVAVGQADLALAVRMNRATLRTHLRELETSGAITRYVRGVASGGRRSTVYKLHLWPRAVPPPKVSTKRPEDLSPLLVRTDKSVRTTSLASLKKWTRPVPGTTSALERQMAPKTDDFVLDLDGPQRSLFPLSAKPKPPRKRSPLDDEMRWWADAYQQELGRPYRPEGVKAFVRERACMKRLMVRFPEADERRLVLAKYLATLDDHEREHDASLRFVADLRLKSLAFKVQWQLRAQRDAEAAKTVAAPEPPKNWEQRVKRPQPQVDTRSPEERERVREQLRALVAARTA